MNLAYLYAYSKDSDQTRQMLRLIGLFAGCPFCCSLTFYNSKRELITFQNRKKDSISFLRLQWNLHKWSPLNNSHLPIQPVFLYPQSAVLLYS